MSRRQRIIHVTSVGSCAANTVRKLGVSGPEPMVRLIADAVGPDYRVTSAGKIIMTPVVEAKGGRSDDAARAADIEKALANDDVAALVCIRGGAWFVRALPRINFDVLKRRKQPIHVFGFSEMTPLVGIAGRYSKCVGLYDLCPGALAYGMARWARAHGKTLTRGFNVPADQQDGFATGWAAAQYRTSFLDFFREVVDVVEGRPSPRQPEGRVLAGRLPKRSTIRVVGGNLTLTVAMLASPYADAYETRGHWLAMEDIEESPERVDRMMASLALAGRFERAEGVLLGNFHEGDTDRTAAAFAALNRHLPAKRSLPVVQLDNVGHVWPIAPLPLHREVTLVVSRAARGPARAHIEIPWASWA